MTAPNLQAVPFQDVLDLRRIISSRIIFQILRNADSIGRTGLGVASSGGDKILLRTRSQFKSFTRRPSQG